MTQALDLYGSRHYRRAEKKAARSTVVCRICGMGAFKNVKSNLLKKIEDGDVYYVHEVAEVCRAVMTVRERTRRELERAQRDPRLWFEAIVRVLARKLTVLAWR